MRQEKGNTACLGKHLLWPERLAKHVLVLPMQTQDQKRSPWLQPLLNTAPGRRRLCGTHEPPPVRYLCNICACINHDWVVCRLPLTHSLLPAKPLGPPEERSECSGCAGARVRCADSALYRKPNTSPCPARARYICLLARPLLYSLLRSGQSS